MKGAAKTSDNKWEGDLLEVDSGKIYSGVVTLEGPRALQSQRLRHDPVPGRDLDQGQVTADPTRGARRRHALTLTPLREREAALPQCRD